MAGQAASAGERGFFSCVGRCCGLECGLHGLRSGLRRCLREGEALALFFFGGRRSVASALGQASGFARIRRVSFASTYTFFAGRKILNNQFRTVTKKGNPTVYLKHSFVTVSNRF